MKRHGLVLLLIIATGCYVDGAAPLPETTDGRYTLRTVDDLPLPAIITDIPNFKVEFIRGIVTLEPDMSFTDSTEVRRTENQNGPAHRQCGRRHVHPRRHTHHAQFHTRRTLHDDADGPNTAAVPGGQHADLQEIKLT